MKSLAGQLLVASRELGDPNFHRTVILLVQHGKDGALGLVLNRPLDVTLKHACEEALEATCRAEGVLRQGGPCPGPLMTLHSHDGAPHFGSEERLEVISGLYFSTDRDELEWLLKQEQPSAMFFLGYSGWGPGQLEREVADGAWIAAATTRNMVFEASQTGKWSKLLTRASLGGRVKPELIPDDPSVN